MTRSNTWDRFAGRSHARLGVLALTALALGVGLACSPGEESSPVQGTEPAAPALSASEIEERAFEVRFLDAEDPDLLAKLDAALEEQAFEVRIEAVGQLEDLGGEPAFSRLGEVLATDPEPKVQLRAVEALDFLGGREAADQLLRGLDAEDGTVREETAESLSYLAEPDHEEAVRAAFGREPDRAVKADLRDVLVNIDAEVPAED